MSDVFLGAGRIRALLRAGGIRPAKSLGQNFVIDPNTIRKVIEVAGVGPEDHVLEIGAGLGSLTVGLAGRAAKVTAMEVDDRLVEILRKELQDRVNVDIVHADALTFDYTSNDATSLVANLPYNIAAQITLAALERGPALKNLTVMTQREVGERLAAAPGSKVYGATSVLVAYHGRAHVAGKVSRNAFFPVPNVDSVVVRVVRSGEERAVPWERFVPVVRAAFGQRRKTLRSALAGVAGSPAAAEGLLREAGVDPRERAERLDLGAFLRIAAISASASER